MRTLQVSEVRSVWASAPLRATGLEAWVSFTLNGSLRVDGVTLRRTRQGARYLSFPSRWDGDGREHPYIHPLDAEDRADLERQVFAALTTTGEVWS
jgi:DNA-binding cell septation regulator SpoVG